MRLSTSSSDISTPAAKASGRRPILTVLAICVVVFLVFEIFSRIAVPRLSTFVGRNTAEWAEAEKITAGGNPPNVLVVGNSLLLDALDFPRLHRELSPDWNVRRLVIEQTSYVDWYFGLRKLYAEGARFDNVVVMLSPTNLVQTAVRGDYFARLMMRPSDFWRVGRMLNLHRTEMTNLLFASVSSFYGLKTELRKVLLLRLLPNLPKFTAAIVRYERGDLREQNLRETGGKRLGVLKELVERHGGRFSFAIPPLLAATNASQIVQQTGARVGVPVIVSIRQGEFGAEYFRDGLHLNRKGAAIYTGRFAPDLRRALESLDVARRGAASSAAAAR